jgi:hypothetical protein
MKNLIAWWVATELESLGSELSQSNCARIGNLEILLWRIIQIICHDPILGSGGGFFIAGGAYSSRLRFFAM